MKNLPKPSLTISRKSVANYLVDSLERKDLTQKKVTISKGQICDHMKKKHLISIGALLGIALLLLAVFFYPKPKTFPEPLGYVSDYENVFTPIQKNRLEERLSNYEAETSREIAVVTIASTSPYNNINDYATDLGNEWGVGKEDINNGLLIVLCKNSREIRISTGYGTEKSLTDSICQRVIDKTMIPYFREGNYFDGIDVGLDELMQYWK